MDIFQKKDKRFIKKYIDLLKWDNNIIIVNGSSGLKNIKYFGDIDLFSVINNNYSLLQIINKIKEIYDKATNNNMYFIEEKIQYIDGTKIKGKYKLIPNNKYIDKQIEYIKLDFIIYFKDRFIELSIIYSFVNKKNQESENMLKIISDEINDKLNEKDYFKSLKRIFSIIGIREALGKKYYKEKLKALTSLFNSEFGLMYQNTENLKAIQKIKRFKSDKVKEMINNNLNFIGYEPQNINKQIEANEKILNKIGLIFLKQISY